MKKIMGLIVSLVLLSDVFANVHQILIVRGYVGISLFGRTEIFEKIK